MKIKLEYNILILQDLLTDHVNIRRVQRQGWQLNNCILLRDDNIYNKNQIRIAI
jgi:hypothetical protein